jgi:hypothetical protein
MTPTEVARNAKLPNANALYNFLNAHSNSLSQATIEKLAAVIPGSTIESLTGLDPTDATRPPAPPALHVRARACSGLMQATFDLPPHKQSYVHVPVKQAHLAAGAFGVAVGRPGAERLYREGAVLACLPIHALEGGVRDGMRAILQRTEAGRAEISVWEFKIVANEAWLWPHSTHPEHQAPLAVPFVPGQALQQPWLVGESRYFVAAVVVGSWQDE